MFIDAQQLEAGSEIRADLCIIGAGAAGLTLARELRGSGRSICLLESGGFEPDKETHELQRGTSSGQAYPRLEETRSRFFGGSTNCWAGYCRPLDAIDFELRDWVPNSGWPFARADLDPYYVRANHLLGLGEHGAPIDRWLGPGAEGPDFSMAGLREGLFQFGAGPLRMGTALREEMADASGLRAVLNANVTHLQLDPLGRRVTGLRVRALGRRPFAVVADRYVLATGGIENARLLLASNDVAPSGVGNGKDLVGRFFMEHPHMRYRARLVTHSPSRLERYQLQSVAGVRIRGLLQPSELWLRRTRSLNFDAQLRSLGDTLVTPFMKLLARATRHVDSWPAAARDTGEEPALYGLLLHHEQAPNAASRVTLGSDRDALGLPRAHLHWKLSDFDRASAQRAHEQAAQALGLAQLGRVRVDLGDPQAWPSDMNGGNHHVGTTRMHHESRQGVVDPNCAVHGVGNLFVAGSSVFPTAGAANPTLTIVALALKLADHLRGGT